MNNVTGILFQLHPDPPCQNFQIKIFKFPLDFWIQCAIIKSQRKDKGEFKMTIIKNFFNITTKYQFEWNDLRTVITVINVILIMKFGLSVAWFGLTVAILGMIKELTGNRHINCLVSYLATIVLNIYFITLL